MLANTPLRRQLLLWLLPPIIIVWLVSAWITYALAYGFATRAYDRSLLDSAIAISGQLRVQRDRVVVDLPQIAQKMLLSDLSDRVYYMVSGPDGEYVNGDRGMPMPPRVAVAAPRRAVIVRHSSVEQGYLDPEVAAEPAVPDPATRASRPPRYYDAEYRGQPVRVAAMSIPLASVSAGQMTGEALVQVAETLGDRHDMARDVLVATLLPQIALMLLLTAIVYVAVGRGLAPLDVLRREIESRSSRDLAPVTEDRAPPEVRRLVHSLNDLLARVAQTLAAQKRFIADAAHQLRTPTAALKTQVEVAQRTNDAEELRTRLGHIHAAAERNARLVNQLLSLARAEPGGTERRAHRPVDLLDITRAETEYWVPQALARSIDLGFEPSCARKGPIEVQGDGLMLAELLGNLIDNALRYTQPGGTVTVSVERCAENGQRVACVAVEDNGPGVPECERERIFERFHRVLGTGTEGAGLGLAIVREIAVGHGGRVDLSGGTEGQGTRFTVVLPMVERRAAAPAGWSDHRATDRRTARLAEASGAQVVPSRADGEAGRHDNGADTGRLGHPARLGADSPASAELRT